MKQGPLEIIAEYEEAYRNAKKKEPPIIRFSDGRYHKREYTYRAKDIQGMTERMRGMVKSD